ncbi:hypothetical protein AN641_09145 [Candidatus Epulonipiscioides gigas]|nr:hypothetical protein AN641_09145 [Epulopiscium sp. SCG-C07WGA-EpuloA2]
MNSRKLVSFDYAMKYILRQKDNFDILEGFLTDLLGVDVTIIEILESESNKIDELNKGNRVDLIIKDSKGQRMIIEIQYAKEQDYLERIIGGTSKIIVDNLDQGKPYKDIVKVISISILHFNIGEGDDYIFKGTISFNGLQKKDAVLKYKVDKFPEYYLIRTKKFDDIVKAPIDEWIYMFKNDEFRENATAKNIDKAKEKLALLKMSKEERKKYELFIKEQTINKSILESAITEGIEIGLKEGEKKG